MDGGCRRIRLIAINFLHEFEGEEKMKRIKFNKDNLEKTFTRGAEDGLHHRPWRASQTLWEKSMRIAFAYPIRSLLVEWKDLKDVTKGGDLEVYTALISSW